MFTPWEPENALVSKTYNMPCQQLFAILLRRLPGNLSAATRSGQAHQASLEAGAPALVKCCEACPVGRPQATHHRPSIFKADGKGGKIALLIPPLQTSKPDCSWCCERDASFLTIVSRAQHNTLNQLVFPPNGVGMVRWSRNTSAATPCHSPVEWRGSKPGPPCPLPSFFTWNPGHGRQSRVPPASPLDLATQFCWCIDDDVPWRHPHRRETGR